MSRPAPPHRCGSVGTGEAAGHGEPGEAAWRLITAVPVTRWDAGRLGTWEARERSGRRRHAPPTWPSGACARDAAGQRGRPWRGQDVTKARGVRASWREISATVVANT